MSATAVRIDAVRIDGDKRIYKSRKSADIRAVRSHSQYLHLR